MKEGNLYDRRLAEQAAKDKAKAEGRAGGIRFSHEPHKPSVKKIEQDVATSEFQVPIPDIRGEATPQSSAAVEKMKDKAGISDYTIIDGRRPKPDKYKTNRRRENASKSVEKDVFAELEAARAAEEAEREKMYQDAAEEE